MAQSSRPQAGNVNTNPTYVDAGPYTADQWATLFRVLFTGDQQATQGVLKDVWNELEPTHPAGLSVSINTGVGVCNGHVFFNDTSAVSITVDGGAARGDALCMVENNTNAALAPGAVYNTVGGANIPPYSTRLAVVKNEAANFTQTNNLYMVKLATFTTGAANITGFTDARDYCVFSTYTASRTRRFFVPPMAGYNSTSSTDITPARFTAGQYAGIILPDNASATAYGTFCTPSDYSSGMTVTAVVSTLWFAGNAYVANTCYYGECTQSRATHSDTTGASAEAVNVTNFYCIKELSLTTPSTGDIVGCRFNRNATSGSDTLTDDLQFFGWIVEYTADS